MDIELFQKKNPTPLMKHFTTDNEDKDLNTIVDNDDIKYLNIQTH